MKIVNKAKILFLFMTFIICSCGGNGTKELSESTQKEGINDKMKETADSLSNSISSPVSAELLIDASVSMKGYVDTSNDPRFNGVISSYLFLVKNMNVSLFDTKKQDPVSVDVFLKQLNNRKINWSKESDLFAMIKEMVECVDHGKKDFSILITDGIMSGSNEEIRNSPNGAYNIVSRHIMTNKIKHLLEGKEMAVIIVKYSSKFKGTYYCYDNTHVNLDDKDRPYYSIICGKREQIAYLNKELTEKKNPNLCSYDNLLVVGEKLPFNIKLSHSHGIKTNQSQKKLIIKKEVRDGDDGEVGLTADLINLPAYMQNEEYMNRNIELFITYKNNEEKIFEKQYYKVSVESKGENKRLILTIKAKPLRGSNIRVKINYAYPDWFEHVSCDDDKDIVNNASVLQRTFNFKYFVNGFTTLQKGDVVKEQEFNFAN